ncbi:cytochrome c oxidase subunit VIa domain-containing protein [Phthorimaea operculella]|nr:cytochrome c oxidase subunit VIa domain-containing protein [Phthorimaea operculella]
MNGPITTYSRLLGFLHQLHNTRDYTLCGPPKKKDCGCPPLIPGGGRKIAPPSDCTPGPIPTNPCCPVFHHGTDTYKRYKYMFFFFMLPVIIIQYLRTCGDEIPAKKECRNYEFMRRRTKRFPWGDGDKSFFHNDHVNSLSSECSDEVRPPYCD